MLIDPLGNILFSKQQEEVIHSFVLTKDSLNQTRNKFPFWNDADQFNILQDNPDA